MIGRAHAWERRGMSPFGRWGRIYRRDLDFGWATLLCLVYLPLTLFQPLMPEHELDYEGWRQRVDCADHCSYLPDKDTDWQWFSPPGSCSDYLTTRDDVLEYERLALTTDPRTRLPRPIRLALIGVIASRRFNLLPDANCQSGAREAAGMASALLVDPEGSSASTEFKKGTGHLMDIVVTALGLTRDVTEATGCFESHNGGISLRVVHEMFEVCPSFFVPQGCGTEDTERRLGRDAARPLTWGTLQFQTIPGSR